MTLPDSFDEFVTKAAAPAPCQHDGCTATGDYVLKIKLWAKGHPKGSHPPIDATFTLRMCAEHRYDVKASGFWTDEGKAMIARAVLAQGRAEPDFDTAEFEWRKASTALGGGLSMN